VVGCRRYAERVADDRAMGRVCEAIVVIGSKGYEEVVKGERRLDTGCLTDAGGDRLNAWQTRSWSLCYTISPYCYVPLVCPTTAIAPNLGVSEGRLTIVGSVGRWTLVLCAGAP